MTNRSEEEQNFLLKFGNRLRDIRLSRGLTQEELAHEAGFSRSYYTEIETGKRNIALLNLHRLAKCLDVQLTELLDMDNNGKEN